MKRQSEAFDIDQYQNELDSIIAQVIPDKEDPLA